MAGHCWNPGALMPPEADTRAAPVLLCGLGAFGQAVAARLLSSIPLRGLDLHPPDWRTPQLQQALEPLLCLGDMRKPHVLRQAGVEAARAVLLLCSDSGTNLETALQVRLINETATIVVRSSADLDSLGSLLQQRLPDLVVVNPLQLSTGTLLQALRPGPQLARFAIDGESFEVRAGALSDLRFQRPLRLEAGTGDLLVTPLAFHAPRGQAAGMPRAGGMAGLRDAVQWLVDAVFRPWFRALLERTRKLQRLPLLLLVLVLLMAAVGVVHFAGEGGLARGVFVTAALLKGDYVDPTTVVLAERGGPFRGDGRLVMLTLLYSLVGTLLSSALVALILDQLLLARLGMRRVRRLRRSDQPFVLVGGGALATQLASLLQRERQAVVRVEPNDSPWREDRGSLFVASLEEAIRLVDHREVAAVALLSGQLLDDLQDTLQLQGVWPRARFALLARSEGTAERLGGLLGGASVISPIEIGADVVVASAFGERVEAVWRLQGENLLQVRFLVCSGDTLVGRTVSRLDHGYGLTVLTLRRHSEERVRTIPSPGRVLSAGDQLVVLASPAALRRVEQGRIRPPAWRLRLVLPHPLDPSLALTVQQSLARHLGLTPAEAQTLIQAAPRLCLPVDPDSGARLIRDLEHQPIRLSLEPTASEGDAGVSG